MSRWLDSEVPAKILEEMNDKDEHHNDEDLVILNEHGRDVCCVFVINDNSELEYVPYTECLYFGGLFIWDDFDPPYYNYETDILP